MTEMSKDDIETLSANAVENSCAKTQYLTASLRKRDKEPSWDGEIYIYNDKRKKKENIEKTVKVQVKGTTRKKNLTKNGLSFYMNDSNMTDLKNYLNNGGCLFFVVYIDEENDSECTIYYTELLPLKIKKIISNEMKTLHLNKFPSNNEKKLKILRHFATHSTRQCSFAENGFATQEEVDKWDKNGYLNGIEICTSDGNIDVKTDFLNKNANFYANLVTSKVPQPIQINYSYGIIKDIVKCPVTINNKVCFDSYGFASDTKENRIFFFDDERIIVSVNKNNKIKNVRYVSCPSNMRSIMKNLKFMILLIENKYFEAQSQKFTLSDKCKKDILKSFYFDNAKLKYDCIYWASKGLIKAKYNGDIDFSVLSNDEINGLCFFYAYANSDKEYHVNSPDLPQEKKNEKGIFEFEMIIHSLKFNVVLKIFEKTGWYTVENIEYLGKAK